MSLQTEFLQMHDKISNKIKPNQSRKAAYRQKGKKKMKNTKFQAVIMAGAMAASALAQ